MTTLSNQEKWKPWMAFVLEGLVLILLITACSTMQASWGWVGLILTELLFLVLAVGTALLHKTPLREVFPLHAPTLREMGGVVVLGVAGVMLSMIATGISLAVAPQSLAELQGIGEFIYAGYSLPVMVLVVALMPAICEETLHRGAILSHLRSLKSDKTIILLMGIFFGLFHLSVSKFLSTAVLGGLLSYLVIKKNNLILPMTMHFLNNLYSVVVGSMSGGVRESMSAVQSIPALQLVGTYCIFGFLAPVLLMLALRLVDPDGNKNRRWLTASLCSVALLIVGVACVTLSI
jgi:membrane protease YdiL (CAAX protease family)